VEIAAVAISKRSWERWKACSWLSTVSTTRHFHGLTVEPIHPQTLLQNHSYAGYPFHAEVQAQLCYPPAWLGFVLCVFRDDAILYSLNGWSALHQILAGFGAG